MPNEKRVPISSTMDIVTARQLGRALAVELGFEGSDLTLIATAISEMARNIVDHSKKGEFKMGRIERGPMRGLMMIASDRGPGIADIEQAMQYGYSTKAGLGLGLPGTKAMMDEFSIESKPGKGTTVIMIKWLRTG